MFKFRLSVGQWSLVLATVLIQSGRSQANPGPTFGFNRVVPGWTNYSTAFTATHDASEYATVASVFTPAVEVRPTEFSVITIWYGSSGQRLNFANFVYRVFIWSSLNAFVNDPRLGDLATFDFPSPTGGSMTNPDATTRGGRPAYLLRFSLASPSITLRQCHEYLIGFAAIAAHSQAGELFVPTAGSEGLSDLQAGNIVPFGWIYLINAGGQTIYSGQLATGLMVTPLGERPRLAVENSESGIEILWPASLTCYTLEACGEMSASSHWAPVHVPPLAENGTNRVFLQATNSARWFRLRTHPGAEVPIEPEPSD